MKINEKYTNILTWVVTVATVILWLPVVIYGFMMYQLTSTHNDAQAMSIGIIGGADGPTSVAIATVGFTATPMDWVLLVGALLLTGGLWYKKIKKKRSKQLSKK